MIIRPLALFGPVYHEHPIGRRLALEALADAEIAALAETALEVLVVVPGHDVAPPAALLLAEVLASIATGDGDASAAERHLAPLRASLAEASLFAFAGIEMSCRAGAFMDVLLIALLPHEGARAQLVFDLDAAMAEQPFTAGERALQQASQAGAGIA